MGLKSSIAKIWANLHVKVNAKKNKNSVQAQQELLLRLVHKAEKTLFGLAHGFKNIHSYEDFKRLVPLQDYESLKPYIDKTVHGDRNILWPEKPLYLAKTSGTTSGSKFIPISKEGMPYQINAARSAIFHFIAHTGNARFTEGKMIFLQGSPELEEYGGIPTGRLSGIVAHHIPEYLQKNRLPSWETNCIADWETKVDKITEETCHENMTLISGIPPWLIMYFEKLYEKTGKKAGELFPNLDLIITGGVNYEPYRKKMEDLMGKKVPVIQTFPASEGFFAFQDRQDAEDMLLLTRHGIFYEFIPLESLHTPEPVRLSLENVETGKDYALVLTTNSGLWAYMIGDVIQFTSLEPYRIIVTGRTKHYTSAFGEHVIAYEAEKAMERTLEAFPEAIVTEFHLAPQVNPAEGLPYHEWFIEFKREPAELNAFSERLNGEMCRLNTYYNDLIEGKVLRELVITKIQEGGFRKYASDHGKLGGQNKLPRLANGREMAEDLTRYSHS